MSQFFRGLRAPAPRAQVRQGDVLLIPVDEIPEAATLVPRDGNRVILAYGEATGHAHGFDAFAASLQEADGRRYLRLREAAELRHEEHGPITVAPGCYEVVIQREFVPPDPQLVFDGRPSVTSRRVID
jgi:hypothetical protein